MTDLRVAGDQLVTVAQLFQDAAGYAAGAGSALVSAAGRLGEPVSGAGIANDAFSFGVGFAGLLDDVLQSALAMGNLVSGAGSAYLSVEDDVVHRLGRLG